MSVVSLATEAAEQVFREHGYDDVPVAFLAMLSDDNYNYAVRTDANLNKMDVVQIGLMVNKLRSMAMSLEDAYLKHEPLTVNREDGLPSKVAHA